MCHVMWNCVFGRQHTEVLEAFGAMSRFDLDRNLESCTCSMCIDTMEHWTKDHLGLNKTIDLPFSQSIFHRFCYKSCFGSNH